MKKEWFTLVELIVVITILAILWIMTHISLTENMEWTNITQEDRLKQIEDCREMGFWYWLHHNGRIICKKEDKVMDCIKEYTNWLDEKYNNPDIITNLREDEYSNVVKTCNEIFWNLIKTND